MKKEKEKEEDVDEDELLLHYASEDIAELKDMIRPEQVIFAIKSYIEDVSIETGGHHPPTPCDPFCYPDIILLFR